MKSNKYSLTMSVNIGVIKTLLSIYEILVGGTKNMATVLQTVSAVCCLSGRLADNKVCMFLVALWDGLDREGHGWDVHVLVDRHAVRGVGVLT